MVSISIRADNSPRHQCEQRSTEGEQSSPRSWSIVQHEKIFTILFHHLGPSLLTQSSLEEKEVFTLFALLMSKTPE